MPMPKLPSQEVLSPAEPTAAEKVAGTIRAARDSVWVIDQELSLETFRRESLNTLKANVGHLEIVVASEEVKSSGQDITDLTSAIARGKEAIALLESATQTPSE